MSILEKITMPPEYKSTILPEYKITMLGSAGVGKTSLLTAIYEKFEHTAGQIEFTLYPDLATLQQLQRCLSHLKSLTLTEKSNDPTEKSNDPNDTLIKPGVGVRGTINPYSFYFNMGIPGKTPSLRLHFQDYPGGWVEKHQSDMNKVVEFLKESVAVLIPIDATAMMEKNGKYHELVNLPRTVTDLIKRAYQNLDSPRLVILAPVKCEKYMQDQKSIEKLLGCVNTQYQRLLEFFQAEALHSKITVVVTPIQTVGNVIFSRIEENGDGEPRFYFRTTYFGAPYAPKDCEQPLKYLLQFIFKRHVERGDPLTRFFRSLFFLNKPFRLAVDKFAKEPANPNCKVLQGDKWLQM